MGHFILGRLQLNLDPRLSGDVVGARLVVIVRRTEGGLLGVGGSNNTNFPQRAGREVVAAVPGLARAHVRFGCAFAEMGRMRESSDEKKCGESLHNMAGHRELSRVVAETSHCRHRRIGGGCKKGYGTHC